MAKMIERFIHGTINVRDDLKKEDSELLKRELQRFGGFHSYRTYSQVKGMPPAYITLEFTTPWSRIGKVNDLEQDAREAARTLLNKVKGFILPRPEIEVYPVVRRMTISERDRLALEREEEG